MEFVLSLRCKNGMLIDVTNKNEISNNKVEVGG